MRLDLPLPARALTIAAHPDDAEFGCGATVAKWAAAGCEVSHLVCTDGAKGTWDPTADPAQLAATRIREQRAAAARLGSTGQLVHLGEVDGELEMSRALVSVIAEWIRRLCPEVVLTHDPWRRWRLHPDHRVVGLAACDAVVAARDPHFFPEHGLPHHRPAAVLLFETEEPDHAEDVSGHMGAKVAALLAHESQLEPTMGISPDDDGSGRATFATRIDAEARRAGRLVGVRHAEAFRHLPGG